MKPFGHIVKRGLLCAGVLFLLSAPSFAAVREVPESTVMTFKNVPDGNYRVKMKIGGELEPGITTVRAESRRLYIENMMTSEGEFVEVEFTVNKRSTKISDTESVRIKKRETHKLNWDEDLTIEIVGYNIQVREITIAPVEEVVTVFLCGNSTVVDQDNEPWGSWGQMIPRFFDENVSIANYAESGESANTFIAARRLKKLLTQIKPGDYLFVEFGHNDQKQKGEGKGAYTSYYNSLREFITEGRKHGAHVVLVTPTQRRSFDENGKIRDTHEDYPDAMKKLAADENVPLIDLHAMTRTLYEALGPEESKKAFVHYPADTFPGQTEALEDNTHFSPYGAYQVAKCVIEGMISLDLPLVQYLRDDYSRYDPADPDVPNQFLWIPSGFVEIEKPDGD